jgi:intracellular sulfur oxidation DsrE/DsrF family protein
MTEKKKNPGPPARIDPTRRRVVASLVAGGGLAVFGIGRALAADQKDALRFPGEDPGHKLVYQFNKSDADYQEHVISSVGAVLRQYGDDVKLVVVVFGPGVHILARNPKRPVSKEIRQRVASLAEYGVEFHACNNTLKSLGWTEKDLLPFAKVVESGAADLMELQEQGFAYVSW